MPESELFFSQVLYRIVRKPPNAVGESYFFYPADQRYMEFAEKVEAEMMARIDEREREKREGTEPPDRVAKSFVGAEHELSIATIAGSTYDELAIMRAEDFRKQYPTYRELPILDLLKFYDTYEKATQEPSAPEESYNEKRDRLKRSIQNLVGKLALPFRMDKPHNMIHGLLNDEIGVTGTQNVTNEQLERKESIAQEWLAGYDVNGQQEEDDEAGFADNSL
jgi:hypothetical protein